MLSVPMLNVGMLSLVMLSAVVLSDAMLSSMALHTLRLLNVAELITIVKNFTVWGHNQIFVQVRGCKDSPYNVSSLNHFSLPISFSYFKVYSLLSNCGIEHFQCRFRYWSGVGSFIDIGCELN